MWLLLRPCFPSARSLPTPCALPSVPARGWKGHDPPHPHSLITQRPIPVLAWRLGEDGLEGLKRNFRVRRGEAYVDTSPVPPPFSAISLPVFPVFSHPSYHLSRLAATGSMVLGTSFISVGRSYQGMFEAGDGTLSLPVSFEWNWGLTRAWLRLRLLMHQST